MTLQLAPSVVRAYALANATVNHGGIKLLSARVPREDHLVVVQATRKPPHYFQEHIVIVITQLLLKSTLRSVDYTGRIAKQSAVLGAFDVKYVPRALVKGLILAGLVVRFAEFPLKKEAEGQSRIF